MSREMTPLNNKTKAGISSLWKYLFLGLFEKLSKLIPGKRIF
jgi:hypothetical protein